MRTCMQLDTPRPTGRKRWGEISGEKIPGGGTAYSIPEWRLNSRCLHETPWGTLYIRRVDSGHTIVCKLLKNLYDLKQGANEWNREFNDIHITNDIKSNENGPCLYSSHENGEFVYISIHVDYSRCSCNEMFNEFEKQICHTLNIKNLGDSNYYLGIKFERYDNEIFCYIKEFEN